MTHTPGPETQATWSPDSTKVAYLSLRDAVNHVFIYDFPKRSEQQLTRNALADAAPNFSPDGKSIAFIRDRKELRVVDLESNEERPLVVGYLGGGFGGSGFAWSPDSRWIAYAATESRGLRNIYVVPATGGAAQPVTFLANTNVSGIHWSPDGKFLIYETSQRTEPAQVARLDLAPRQPKFTEERFEELFKAEGPRAGGQDAAGPETKPPLKVEIDFNEIRERISMLPLGLPVSNPQISPDGRLLLFASAVGGQSNLYTYPIEEQTAAGRRGGQVGTSGNRGLRQLTSSPGPKTHAQFSPDSREVFFLDDGRVSVYNLETSQTRSVTLDVEMDVDFNQEKMAVFEQAWAAQRDGFYDPKYHGADWNAARKTYAPLIEGSHTPDEMRRLLRLMVGELNSSHSGVSAPNAGGAEGPRAVIGQLGLTFDRAEYEASGKFKIVSVLPLSPAAIANVKPGEELLAVDGAAMGARVNLDEQLQHKIGKRVVLNISGRDVTVRPVSTLAEQIYRKWVEDNRAYVARVSNRRLGYVHIRDMSDQALTQLYLDLDSENRSRDGVIIDIRNNNGGFVNAYALDVLARRPYLTMTTRGGPAAPARTALGQRSLELPTILVVNQHSLSDAEDFTEGYRTLKLGKVVGEPTAGWIIYTGSVDLVDGSVLRMPGTLITGADGKNMENNPRPVDIAVSRPIGESYTGKDSQLDAAVKELLAEIH